VTRLNLLAYLQQFLVVQFLAIRVGKVNVHP
jgi:hypothetical protein